MFDSEKFPDDFIPLEAEESDFLTPTRWQGLIPLSQACPQVFKLLAGDEWPFRPIGDDDGETAQHSNATIIRPRELMRNDVRTAWGRVCTKVRDTMPTNEDINVFVGSLLSNIGSTVETMKISFDHFPQGIAVAVTIEHVRRLNELSAQINHT